MAVASTPIKDNIAQQKDIFRLAATLYSETSTVYSSGETQLQILKCIFVKCENQYLTTDEIIAKLLDIYKYHITEDELVSIIKSSQKTFLCVNLDKENAYKLTETAYSQTVESQKENIDTYIDRFIEESTIQNNQDCKDAIHQYLYELTTSNVNSYQVLLSGNAGIDFSDQDLSVNIDYMPDNQRQMVQEFLEWDNAEKNIALFNVVFCCLEYCLLINGDSPNKLIQSSIRKREIYLDTNMVFRALGINGLSRQKVVEAFLVKCRQAKIKIFVSSFTKTEFFESIEASAHKIALYPRGKVFEGAFEQISDYSIFTFYEEWHTKHPALSLKYFIAHIKSLYSHFVSKYGITDNEKIPVTIYNSKEFKEARNSYARSIKTKKQEIKPFNFDDETMNLSYSRRDSHDASIVRFIEILRENYNGDRDVFLVSSDKALRFWDMTRNETTYPVVIYPSQLFLILVKLCGRSNNDYTSFVNFINVRARSKQVTPEVANIIISGISSITEDIETQEILVSSIYDDEFQNIIHHCKTDEELFSQTQNLSQRYLDTQLKMRDAEIASISASSEKDQRLISSLKNKVARNETELKEIRKKRSEDAQKLEKKQQQICEFAEKRIQPWWYLKSYIIPVIVSVLALAFIVFIGLQFFFCDQDWNYAMRFLNWVKTTAFGQEAGDYIYAVDAAFFGIVAFLLRIGLKNPFDKSKREQEKADLIQKYIDTHNLN